MWTKHRVPLVGEGHQNALNGKVMDVAMGLLHVHYGLKYMNVSEALGLII